MELVVLIIHLLVCICLIGLVLLQRSEGGALGMGGGGGGALMSGRGAADALAKMTSVAGGFFLVTSLGLTVLSGATASTDRNILDNIDFSPAPITAPAAPATTTPAQPETTAPDPTESSAPQAAETRLASVMPGPSAAAATPLPSNTTRAAPLAPSTTGGATPANTVTRNTATANNTARVPAPTTTRSGAGVTPASANQTTRTQPAPTTTRSGVAPTQASGQTPTQPLVLPNTSGAVTGITLSDDPAQQTESIQIGNGNVEAVRRERAGPDQ